MHLTTLLSSLPLPFEEAVRQAAALGFTHVDVVAVAQRPASHREALADSGLLVSCAAVARGLPDGQALDAADVSLRRAAVEAVKQQLTDAAQLGATHAYLVPALDNSAAALRRFGEACALLADYSAGRKVRLCVEHIPGRALPRAADVLAWLDRVGSSELALLLDVGHCLITNEDAAAVVREAKDRLGYVHFDDNDGVGDLHWPLLKGRLTEAQLRAVTAALLEVGYDGALCLELNPENANPLAALREGKAMLEKLVSDASQKR